MRCQRNEIKTKYCDKNTTNCYSLVLDIVALEVFPLPFVRCNIKNMLPISCLRISRIFTSKYNKNC